MLRSTFGDAVLECWNALPAHYANLTLDAFVVMPNHVHGILILDVGAGLTFQTRPRCQSSAAA
jgi:putative transposase